MMATVQVLLYLDSRTLQVLLVKLEMTSWRISFRYLSTCSDDTLVQLLIQLQVFVLEQEPQSPTRVLSVTNASQMLVMACRMLRLGSNW